MTLIKNELMYSHQKINLGKAWSGNALNTAIFRHHSILTINSYQFTAFYRSAFNLRVVRRNLGNASICIYDIKGIYNIQDAHNCISLGMDREGCLHISYDLHGSRLRYRRSKHALDIYNWSDEISMSGQPEEKITYPTFIVQNKQKPLLFMYREGNWKCGRTKLKEYSENKKTWIDRSIEILSGLSHQPWTSNPYWNHPCIDKNGTIHLSFTWRTDYTTQEKIINNSNIDYAKSGDNGITWSSSRGQPLFLPITQVNSETVFAVSPGSNLINQTSMAVDSKGNPHIVFYANDPSGVPQYQHLWFDRGQWKCQCISKRDRPFTLSGSGTLQLPISRPEIVIDKNDVVYVIYRGDLTKDKLVAQRLLPPLYEVKYTDTLVLWDQPLGYYEPIIDRIRWQRDEILTLYIQYCEQPNHEGKSTPRTDYAYLVDRDLTSKKGALTVINNLKL